MIVLPAAQRAALAAHVEADYPNEACGFLLGRRRAGKLLVSRVAAAANVAAEPAHRFEADPGLRLRLEKAARRGGARLLGHYHSHPDGPARPSATDRAGIFEADLVWLIAAVTRGRLARIAAYQPRADGGGFDEVEIEDADEIPPDEIQDR